MQISLAVDPFWKWPSVSLMSFDLLSKQIFLQIEGSSTTIRGGCGEILKEVFLLLLSSTL